MVIDQITADSTPDYDMPFNPFDSSWTMADWISWHKALLAKYGSNEAQNRFITAWEDQSAWSMPYSFWKYNNEFVDYFNSQGFNVGHALSKTVSNVSKGIERSSQLTKILLPLGVVAIGMYVYKQLF